MQVIYKTENFIVFVPEKPHISREDGGHLCIASTNSKYLSRLDLTMDEAYEFIRLSMIVGEAMIRGLAKRGIRIGRINYQENGNWAFLRDEKPFFHLHLYGRVENSIHQKWGEALYFPDPKSTYYDNLKGLDEIDIEEIKKQIYLVEENDKYKK